MAKKWKREKTDGPLFEVGEVVTLRGKAYPVERIIPCQGNRPRYALVGVQGFYSETYLRKV